MNWSNSARSLAARRPVEEVAELSLLLVELAQRLLAILVEGDVAAALVAPAMAALPGAPFLARLADASTASGEYQRP
jgi:hypothetical protein